ncbi:MAG TPA: 50S ribosomal protein L15 [Longimicrobiales bacterium]|nr:50S ribosomal protein L15 [Longimicrobiales bacterium]
MTDLSNLRRPAGAHRAAKRLGRGPGSGLGKTSGKGHKGHKARTGGKTPVWFEGGQMPLQRRLPKRGFKNAFRKTYEIVNLRDLDRIEADEITLELLHQRRVIDLGKKRPVKILGDGEIQRKVTVQAHAVTASARAKIEAAGGTVELLES